ncbi:hypothetical protein LTR95_004156, partial [Oleoguttula sp. CCFEE 5521]
SSVVIDWNYHWFHEDGGVAACNNANGLDPNCVIEGANYAAAGVATSGDALTLHQYVLNNGTYQNASPRVYLLAPDGQNYDMIKLLGQEISYDVDGSTLVCGENGALYLSEMDATGGRSAANPGGAAYGAGYCDAQCPIGDWFNGTVNTGGLGSCCNEMDLWEANGRATALTPHPCSVNSIGGCTGSACGSTGYCDKNGCGFNPYALGQQGYYGPGLTVDTNKKITVTTSFHTSDGTATGTLTEITRQYIQDGVVIANAVAGSSSGFPGQNSLTDPYCSATDSFGQTLGGLKTMGQALGRGMVLVLSIWNDAGGYMTWLDSGNSGPCSATEGNPSLIIQQNPNTYVTFSNIRYGDIGSTWSVGKPPVSSSSSSVKTTTTTRTNLGSTTVSTTMSSKSTTVFTTTSKSTTTTKPAPPTTTSTKPAPPTTKSTTTTKSSATTTKPSQLTATHYGQCGGKGYTGPTVCASPWTCKVSNDYYSQCL